MEMSRLTSKHQATVPLEIRAALGLRAGDMIAWDVVEGVVRVHKVDTGEWAFLKGLEKNLADEWLSEADMEAFRDL